MSLLRSSEKTGLISFRNEPLYYGVQTDEISAVPYRRHRFISDKFLPVVLGLIGLFVSTTFIAYSIYSLREPLEGTPLPVSRIPVKTVNHPETPSPLWGTVGKPFPTGAFWTNLVVKNGDGPIGVLPYGIKCVDSGVQVSYGAYRRIVSPVSIFDPFVTDIQISATQAYISRALDSYDNASVTMSYKIAGNGKYRTHLVKGSPFVTVVYEGATPVISVNQMQILNAEARLVRGSVGMQYIVTLGNFQKWLVYCSEPIAFTWKDNTLTAPSAIRGMIRVAILPLQNADTAFNFLLGYIQRYPIGTQVSLTYPTATTMSLNYQFITQGSGPLLMLALPHHMQLMATPDSDETRAAQSIYGSIYCIKGKMKPVVGDSWKLSYNLVQVGWNYAVADKLSNAQLDSMAYWLQIEVKTMNPSATDTYNFGKELGRMARLALIADNLGIADARQQAVASLENSLNPWIQNTNPNALVYDRVWGGLLSTRGVADSNAEFGLGWYNDHHFHYGYFIYAFATLARLDPAYVEPRRPFMELLVRDVCNFDPTDADFPIARHKDFYDGHSWASGLFQQSNGKNQESSSEAVNAYYACFLYGLATSSPDLTNFAHSLLTMEIQAAQKYWHMTSDNEVYDDVFKVSRMVGNVGALDVTTTTWFGSAPEYVHGINMMPVTPALAVMMDQLYVEQEWPVLMSRLPAQSSFPAECSKNTGCASLGLLQGACCPTPEGAMLECCDAAKGKSGRMSDEWLSLLYIDHAVVDRESAWNQILTLGGLGSGNSRANALFWAASRPPPRPSSSSNKVLSPQQVVRAACSANSACDALGMIDDCCPSSLGIYLGCCPKISMSVAVNPASPLI